MAAPKSTMALYQRDGSCSLVPHALLYHLHIPFRRVSMKTDANSKYVPADGSMTHAEYQKLNPTGYVPALDVGNGVIIAELPAVIAYIINFALESDDVGKEDKEKASGFLGRTAVEKAQVVQWLTYLSGTMLSLGFAALWRPYRCVDDHKESYEHVKEKGRKVIETSFARIEEILQGREWLVGNELTVVDFNLYVYYWWGLDIEIDMEKTYPEFGKLMRKVEALEGMQKVIEAEKLDGCFRE